MVEQQANTDIEKKRITGYVYMCPVCSKVIKSLSEQQIQHLKFQHRIACDKNQKTIQESVQRGNN